MPCPRFAIQALGGLPSLKLSHILFTSFSIVFRPPYKTFGSRLPWSATLDPTSLRASEGSIHQSRPRTSYPTLDAREARAKLAPFAKRVKGTWGSRLAARAARRFVDICWRDGVEKVAKS